MQTEEQIQTEFPENYTIIDIETTGLSCDKNEIIELSAIKVRNNKIDSTFSSLVKPNSRINSFITGLTGISNSMVEQAPSIDKVLPEYLKFISNDTIMGHNVKFDIRFIKHNAQKHLNTDFGNASVDTMKLSRKYCTMLTSHKLETIAKHFNISTDGHHRALTDCEITNKVYINIKNSYSPQKV